jgi:acyl-CoA synthetase (NDP forming)
VALGAPPLNARQAQQMLAGLRGAAILQGTRGERPADTAAIVDLLQRFSRLTLDLRGLVREIDMNPVIVFDEGEGLKVVDCLIVPASAAGS